MVRRRFFQGAAIAGIAVMCATAASAQQVDLRLKANKFNVKLVQAFDECDPEGSSVTTLGNGLQGCPDGDLDGTAFNLGKLIVKFKIFPTSKDNIIMIVKSSGTQLKRDTKIRPLAGKDLRLRITLRVSEVEDETLGDPEDGLTAENQVTYADQELTCPSATVPANGNLVHKFNLASCLTPGAVTLPSDVLKNTTNKEIVRAQVEDANTSLALAVPGVRHIRP